MMVEGGVDAQTHLILLIYVLLQVEHIQLKRRGRWDRRHDHDIRGWYIDVVHSKGSIGSVAGRADRGTEITNTIPCPSMPGNTSNRCGVRRALAEAGDSGSTGNTSCCTAKHQGQHRSAGVRELVVRFDQNHSLDRCNKHTCQNTNETKHKPTAAAAHMFQVGCSRPQWLEQH